MVLGCNNIQLNFQCSYVCCEGSYLLCYGGQKSYVIWWCRISNPLVYFQVRSFMVCCRWFGIFKGSLREAGFPWKLKESCCRLHVHFRLLGEFLIRGPFALSGNLSTCWCGLLSYQAAYYHKGVWFVSSLLLLMSAFCSSQAVHQPF